MKNKVLEVRLTEYEDKQLRQEAAASVEPPLASLLVPEPTMMLGLLGISSLMLTQQRRSKPKQ
jgi:hypothetical protein